MCTMGLTKVDEQLGNPRFGQIGYSSPWKHEMVVCKCRVTKTCKTLNYFEQTLNLANLANNLKTFNLCFPTNSRYVTTQLGTPKFSNLQKSGVFESWEFLDS